MNFLYQTSIPNLNFVMWLVATMAFMLGIELLIKNKPAVLGRLKSFIISIRNIDRNKRFAYEIGTTPRQLIYCIDIVIVLLAVLLNGFLNYGIDPVNFTIYVLVLQTGIYLAIHGFTFFKFNTYVGSVRHSTLYDALKLLLAVGSAHILLFFIDEIFYLIFRYHLFNISLLIYGLAITYLGLLLFRLSIKAVFHRFKSTNRIDSGLRTVIYGVDYKSVSLAESMLMDESCKFEIIAFISNNRSKINTSILERPIISVNNSLSSTMQNLGASILILATEKLSAKEKFDLVGECTKNNIKIYIAPLVSYDNNDQPIARKLRDLCIDDLLYRDPIQIDIGYLTTVVSKQVVLVTGGAGSIGSELVVQLAELNARQIIVFDIAESPLFDLEMKLLAHYPDLNFQVIVGDVTHQRDIEKVFMEYRPNYIFHASAYKHVPMMEKNPAQAIKVNILGTKIVADLAIKYKAERFVLISTDKAVNPVNIMGVTKRVAELYIQAISGKENGVKHNNTKFITTRFGNVLGSNGSVVPLFKRQINEGGPVTVTHPDITRYFMTIPEACQLVLITSCMGSSGDIFLFDMGTPIKIMELAAKMIQLAGLEPNIDIEIRITGLRPGEKLYEELYSASAQVMPTDNPKILKVVERRGYLHDIQRRLKLLFDNLHFKESEYLKEQLMEMVPEYRSPLIRKVININTPVPSQYDKIAIIQSRVLK